MRQGELFQRGGAEHLTAEVPGFRMVSDYISREQEAELLTHIDRGPWETDFRRRIQQYGLGYSGELGRKATWIRDLPKWLLPLAARVQSDAPLERFPENAVINEYVPPLGIGPHRDYLDFGPTIACVSLGSDIVLDFTHPHTRARVPVVVPGRSLWVITGPARLEWEHGIAARLSDIIEGVRVRRERRVSITFRTARQLAARPAGSESS